MSDDPRHPHLSTGFEFPDRHGEADAPAPPPPPPTTAPPPTTLQGDAPDPVSDVPDGGFESMTVPQLRMLALERGIPKMERANKAPLIDALSKGIAQ
jgi:hypothetical protein